MAFISSKAFGFSYSSYAGDPIVWPEGESDTFYIDHDCFPSDSDAGELIVNSMHEWENVGGADFDFHYSFSENEDNALRQGDGRSEIIYTSAENIEDAGIDYRDEAGGVLKWYGWNLVSTWITETDIYFIIGNYLGSNTPIHELGHALGLGHTTDYGIMGYGGNLQEGDHSYAPVADDRQGIRYLYPDSSKSETDIGISLIDANIVEYSELIDEEVFVGDWLYDSSVPEICPGDNMSVAYTVFNNGTDTETFHVAFYAYDAGVTIESNTIHQYTLSSGVAATREKTITIPQGLEPKAIYDLFAKVVLEEGGSEEDYTNNETLMKGLYVKAYDECPSSSWTLAQHIAHGHGDLSGLESFPGAESTLPSFKDSPIAKAPLDVRNTLPLSSTLQDKNYASFPALTDPANTGVYEGTVKKVETRRGTDGKTPYTYTTFKVEETVKGKVEAGEEIVIRQAGGRIWDEQKQQGEGLMIPGAPELIEGDHLVIFLGRNNHDLIPFVGGEAGVLRIANDTDYGEFVTTFNGSRIMDKEGDDFLLGSHWEDQEVTERRKQNPLQQKQISSKKAEARNNVSLQEESPMPKNEFLQALKENLRKNGPYEEIKYQEKEAGAIVIHAAHHN